MTIDPLTVAGALASLLVGKASLVAIAGALAVGAGRSRRGRGAHAGAIASCALVVLPSLMLLLPRWELPLFALPHRLVLADGHRASPAVWLAALWLCGSVVLLLRLVNDLRAAASLARSATAPVDARARPMIDALVARLRITLPIDLRASEELATAALLGWRRPVVLLPARCHEWADEELFAVLRHEIEHVLRRDWLALVAQRVVEALYWPNPLVQLLGRRAALARELAADDAVLRAGVRPETYARRLIAVARELTRHRGPAVAIAFAGDGIDRRVRALFDADRHSIDGRVHRPRGSLSMLAALPLLAVLAAAQPWICLPEAPSSRASAVVPCP
jgi:hypothetical protein